MGKDPAFPWYASDWLGSTARAMMTLQEQAAYINLLCHQWGDVSCSLPDDDEILARLSGLNEQWLKGSSQIVRGCFPKHPQLQGRVANARMLEIRQEREDWRAKCRMGGLKSAEVRRAKSTSKRTSGKPKSSLTTLGSKGATKRQLNGNSSSPSPSPSPSHNKEEATNVASSPHPSSGGPAIGVILPLQKSTWELPAKKLAEYEATFGGQFDVALEIRKARQWLIDNKARRPRSPRGAAAFLTRWLNRSEEASRGGSGKQLFDIHEINLGD